YSGLNNRIGNGAEDGNSLYLISVERLRLLVGRKAPNFPDSKRAVLGEFQYQSITYRMDITDPVIERSYLSREDGPYEIQNPVLCVSLGEFYQGYFYKLIAAILHKERFE
ncbi:MAG TPA: hypothetical protein PLI09_28665, partial [Candidatus Hydrogenedentes bacterium]|nr:hypothetical protein [Candidatus Hydrogenedentota bacterium]